MNSKISKCQYVIPTAEESRSAISQEDLHFPALEVFDGDNYNVIPRIPKFYINHTFTSRAAAMYYFLNHNTPLNLGANAEYIRDFRSTCVHMTTRKNMHSRTCNFNTRSIERHLQHVLLGHKMIITIGMRSIESIVEIPDAQDDIKRHALRQHLFGARLATLCKMGRVPVFNKTTNLIERSYAFNDKVFTMIFSLKDDFTTKYLTLLRPLEVRAQFGDFNISVGEDATKMISQAIGNAKMALWLTLLGSLTTLVGVVSSLSILLANPTPFIANAAIVSLLAHLGHTLAPLVINFLSAPRAQSGFSWIPVAISFSLMFLLGGKNIGAIAGFEIFKKAHFLGVTLGSIGVFHRIFSEAWKELYPFVHNAIFGNAPTFDECLSQLGEFKDLVERVADFEKEIPGETPRWKTMTTSREACDEAISMMKLLEKLYTDADRLKIRPQFTPAVKTIHEKLSKWRTEAVNSPHGACGTRIEPVVLHMFGESGVGKSLITALIATEVMKDKIKIADGSSIHNHIYTRNASSDFWAGYRGQAVVVFDDFMQKVDSESNANPEVFEVIQSANNAPFLLPMAEISEKQNSYFISKLIILTSNVSEFKPKSITHPEALRRRMDVVVKVTRTQPKPTEGNDIDTSCYSFKLIRNGQDTNTALTFEELVTILRMKRSSKEASCQGLTEALAARMSAPIISVPLGTSQVIMDAIELPAYTEKSAVPRRGADGRVKVAQAQGLMDYIRTPLDKATGYDYFKEHSATEIKKKIEEIEFTPEEVVVPQLAQYFLAPDVTLARFIVSEGVKDTDSDLFQGPSFRMVLNDNETVDDIVNNIAQNLTAERQKVLYTFIDGGEKRLLNYFNLTYFSAMSRLYKDSAIGQHLSSIMEAASSFDYRQAASDFLRSSGPTTVLCFSATIAVGFYLLFKKSAPPQEEEIMATPAEYSAVYNHIIATGGSTELLSEDAYEEIYNCKAPWVKNKSILHDATLVARESWDIEGKTPRMRAPVKGVTMARKQAAIDGNGESVAEKVKNNMASFHPTNNTNVQGGCGVFVRGRVCLMNVHVLNSLQQADPEFCYVTLPNNGTISVFPWKDLKSFVHPTIDLAGLAFPTQVRDHVDILDHIARQDDLKFEQCHTRIILKRKRSFETVTCQSKVKFERLRVMLTGDMSPDGSEQTPDCTYFDVKNFIHYSGTETKAGDCGALVMHCNPRIDRKIMGMHVAGTPNNGFAFMLVREHVDTILDQFSPSQKLVFIQPTVTKAQGNVDNIIGGSTELFGAVTPLFEPVKTAITPSEIPDVFEQHKRPAILRKTNGFDPLLEGAKKYGAEPHYITEAELDSCRSSVEAALFPGDIKISRDLTTEEAIFGIPDLVEELKTDTSPGYPWCTHKTKLPGKKHWINTEERSVHKALLEAIEKLENNSAQGIIEPCIFRDTLKDERRPLKRTDPNDPANIKTRLVSAAPMELSIVLKKYYGAFMTHIQEHKIQNTVAIGVNPYGVDWQFIANYLHEMNDKANDGDYAGFDVSQLPAFLGVFFDVGRKWYRLASDAPNSQDFLRSDRIREVISRHVMFATHICQGYIYRAQGKLPSGTLGTTQINSSTNLSAFQYAFDKLFPSAPGPVNFHNNVRFISQGDDNIFSVSPTHEKFTCQAIGGVLDKIGMTYTAATKGDGYLESRPIEECTFLKRGFKRFNGFYKAPLDLKTCEDMVMWTKKSDDNISATQVNVEMAAKELAIADTTNTRIDKIKAAMMKKGIYTPLPTLQEVLADHQKFY